MFSNIFALAATGTSIDKVSLTLGIVLIVIGLFLVISVLMQSGKDKNLSGTIAGGADTFFSKSKASTWDKILSKLTFIFSIVFAILVIVMWIYVGR